MYYQWWKGVPRGRQYRQSEAEVNADLPGPEANEVTPPCEVEHSAISVEGIEDGYRHGFVGDGIDLGRLP